MKLAEQSCYEGWQITISCEENKPINCKPSDKIFYTAQTRVELLHPNQSKHLWSTTATCHISEVSERKFDNFNDAYSLMIIEAKALIDTWKK